MGQWTIVIHGTGAHHNWETVPDPKSGGGGHFISGRKNDYDADLMFAEFVDALKAKGHAVTGSTFTHGGMEGADNVIRADYQNPHLPPKEKPAWRPTILELSYGGDHQAEVRRYFRFDNHTDAIVRMSEAVQRMDSDPAVHAAWVHFKRLPDSIYPEGQTLASWTKTSDERPTAEGAPTPEEAV